MPQSVVLIDDDDDDILLLSDCLLSIDKTLQITAFNDCEEALDKLLTERIGTPDFIFIDINMPKVMGPQCLQMIRNQKVFDNSRIVMVSTTMWDTEAAKHISNGANFAIKKPVKFEEYCHLLTKIILS